MKQVKIVPQRLLLLICGILCVLALLVAAAAALLRPQVEEPAGGSMPRQSSSHSLALTSLAITGDAAPTPVVAAPMATALPIVNAGYTLSVEQYRAAQLDSFAVPGWNAVLYTVRYESNDEAICTVDENGLVSGVSAGEAVITATATAQNGSSISATCAVTVEKADPPITGLTLVRTKAKLRMGGTGSDLTVTGCEPAEYFDVLEMPAYASSDESVCVVDENGHITAIGPGTATVTVSLYGVTAECAITVLDSQLKPVSGIQLLGFSSANILSIGNQTAGRCSWYAMRYARTIVDGTICSGSGMWRNGAVWSAGGFSGWSGDLAACLNKMYSELAAGRPVLVHVQNTYVGTGKHPNRVSTYEYHATGSGWQVVDYAHISTSSTYGHWMCVVGVSADADPANLRESDFFALDPARVTVNGNLVVTRMLDGTLWTSNSPLKVLG